MSGPQGQVAMTRRTSRDIRRANRFEVVRHIYATGPASRQEIAAESGLSFATVATVVSELLDFGVLRESSLEDSGGGRPRARLAVNPRRGWLIGVDIAETYVQVELLDLALTVTASVKEALHPEDNQPGAVVDHIVAGIDAVIGQAGIPRADVVGVGVSLPGQVDRAGGVSVFAPNFSWQAVPFIDLLRARVDLPLHLDNPLKASTVAELWFGAGRRADDIVVLTIGTGVGAGIAIGGSLIRGVTNCAGEWGHTAIVLDGRLCRCGNRGCVEAYVGAPAIMAQLRDLAPGSRLLHPEDQDLTLTELAAALGDGDEVADAVIDETARYLGVGIANLINTLNPAIIVLGGWVCERIGPWLLPAARATAARHTFDRTLAATSIELSTFTGNPVSRGAATFALEGFLAELGVPSRHDPSRPVASARR